MSDLLLRVACIHGRYEKHMFYSPELPHTNTDIRQTRVPCPGGREVTEAEIIAAYQTRTNATGGNVDAPAI